DQADQLARHLLRADMSGFPTQGVAKLTGTEPLQRITPVHDVRIERDTKLSQLLNAGAHPAPLVSYRATDVAIGKAREHGFGIVGVHNTFSSNGPQAYYAERIAAQDLIGIVMARSPGAVAPFGSAAPLFGTNPIGFSFPTLAEPLVFDMSTSAMNWYGLVLAKAKGQPIPDNIAIDRDGRVTTDPGEAMSGALLPWDCSYKGSGLGLVIELMAGPLAASAYCDCTTFDKDWGSTFIAIDPGLLVDVERFKSDCSGLIATVQASRKKPDVSTLRLPGTRSRTAYEKAAKSGIVEADEGTLRELGWI
ncbi:MAG: Ldh family oxidoreductase, partial [Mycobacteriales bacterium]